MCSKCHFQAPGDALSHRIALAGAYGHALPGASLQEWRGKEEMLLNRAQHCWSPGREKYRGTELSEECWESGWDLSPSFIKTKQTALGWALGASALQQGKRVDQQSFGRVMSKAERCCLTFISETQAVEFGVEKHLYWLLKGTHVTQRYAM